MTFAQRYFEIKQSLERLTTFACAIRCLLFQRAVANSKHWMSQGSGMLGYLFINPNDKRSGTRGVVEQYQTSYR